MRYGLIFALVAGAIVTAALIAAAIIADGFALDFGVFWRAAQTPASEVYRPDPWLPFVYPPTAIPWLRPLALLPFWPAFALWSALSVALFFVAAKSRAWWLIALSPGLIECVTFGQTSLFVGALLLFACTRRGWQMGVLLAVAFSLKPQMLVMAPLILLVRRDWPALAGGALCGLALLLFTCAQYGPGIWLAWLRAMPGFAQVIDHRNLYWATITPYGLAAWSGVPPVPVWIACAALSIAAVLRSACQWDNLAMPMVVTSILTVPYAVPHDLVAALPWCTAMLLRRDPDWRQAPAALLFSATMVPIAAAMIAGDWAFVVRRTPPPEG